MKEIKKEEIKFKFLARYIDLVVSGLIGFFIIISFLFLLKYILNIGGKWLIIISFLVAMLISPLISKIRIGKAVANKYFELINKRFLMQK